MQRQIKALSAMQYWLAVNIFMVEDWDSPNIDWVYEHWSD